MLPKLVCAACWPAYTALLGSVGIGFVNYTPYLLPLTVAGLLVAVGSLGLLARRRGRIEPLLLGLAAATAILIGKFGIGSDPLLYVGVGMLMVTSLVPWPPKATRPMPADCCNE